MNEEKENYKTTLIVGPMYSGKSTALVQRMEKYLYAKKKVLLIRPKKDDRGYVTHNNLLGIENLEKKFYTLLFRVYMNEVTKDNYDEIKAQNFDAVFIDEYFMIKNSSLFAYSNPGGDVYFAGLLASSEGKLFDETIRILPFCDSIHFLKAVCTKCGKDASMTLYTGNKSKDEDIIVDTNDTLFEPVCKECWKKFSRKGEVVNYGNEVL